MRRLLVLAIAASSCAHGTPPLLGHMLSRVDVPRLLDCAMKVPDYKAAALCLGAEAATVGLRAALDRATALAEQAQDASGPAGADDYTDADRAGIATDLDVALDTLAVEIHATHAE